MHQQLGSFCAAVALACATFTAPAAENHWAQSQGGSWHDPANWSLGTVPTAGDEVFVDAPGDYVVTLNQPTAVYKMHLGGDANGTAALHVFDRLDFFDLVVQTNGLLETGAGADLHGDFRGRGMIIHGSWKWHDGVWQIASLARIEGGGQLQILGTADKEISSFDNYGTLIWDCLGAWVQGSYAQFHNYGHIELRSNFQLGFNNGYFYNYGTLACPPGIRVIFDASGADDRTYRSRISHYGAIFTPGNGADITFSGKHGFIDGTTFNGPGTIGLEGGIFVRDLITANTLVKAADIKRSWFGTWTGTGKLEWESGTLDGHIRDGLGMTVISNDFTMRIVSDSPHALNYHTITNLGTIEWDAPVLHGTNSAIYNEGTVVLADPFQLLYDSIQLLGDGNFYNSGTIRTWDNSYSILELSDNWTFHNSGTLTAGTGTELYLSGTFQLNDGTIFDGPGTTFLDSGNFGGAGTITVNGRVNLRANLRGDHSWTGPGLLWTGSGATMQGSIALSEDFTFEFDDILSIGNGSLTNKGTFVLPVYALYASNGEFHNEGTLIVAGYGYTFGSGNLYNRGTLLSTNYATLEIDDNWTFHNSGRIQVAAGTDLYLSGTYLFNTGTSFDGPGVTLLSSGTFGGAGILTANSRVAFQGNLTGNHTWTGSGVMESGDGGAVSGTTVFNTDFHVELKNGSISLTGGTVTNQGTISIENQTIGGSGGKIYNKGAVEVSGYVEFAGSGQFHNSGTIKGGEITSPMMSVGNDWTFINAGTFYAGTGVDLFLSGSYLLNDGTTFDGAGQVVLDSGTFGGTGTITVNGTVELSGDLAGNHVWTGPGLLNSHGNGEFSGNTILSNTFEFQSVGNPLRVSGSLTNHGTMHLAGGAILGEGGRIYNEAICVVSDFVELSGSGNWFNTGTLSTDGEGFANFYAGGNWTFLNSGTFSAGAGHYLELGGSYLLHNGSTFDSGGLISMQGTFGGAGIITLNGVAELDGSVVGDHTWTGPGRLDWVGGNISGNTLFGNGFSVMIPSSSYTPSIGSGSLTNRGTIGWIGGPLHGLGGKFHNEGRVVVTDQCELIGTGNFYNSGTISVPAEMTANLYVGNWTLLNNGNFHTDENAFLQLEGPYFLNEGTAFSGPGHTYLASGTVGGSGTIIVDGTVELSGAILTGNHLWEGPGLLKWSSGGFNDIGATTFADNFNVHALGSVEKIIGHSITNLGAITWSGSCDVTNSAAIINFGTFQIEGELHFNGNGAFHNSGTYEQNGTVRWAGHFNNAQRLTLHAGLLDIGGSYTAASDSIQEISISGIDPLLSYGQIQANSVHAAGDLNVLLSGGFSGQKGDSFDLITFANRDGTFANVRLPETNDESAWRSEYKANSFTVSKGFAEAPVIITGLQDQTFRAGADYTFSVLAEGTGRLFYQWALNGTNLVNATNDFLSLVNLQPSSTGLYSVTITNKGGSVSSSASLTVVIPPSITTQPATTAVLAGSIATFNVHAEGDRLVYRWFFNGSAIANATNSDLTMANVQPSHAGNYHVVIGNEVGGQTSSNATLTVNLPPHITSGPADQTVISGTNVIFSVQANGTGTLAYQWQHNGALIPGETRTTLLFTNVQTAHIGTYGVSVTSDFGSTSASATLLVRQTPFIISQPEDRSEVLGSNAVFTVEAGGENPLLYQWFFNGEILAGATNATLTLTNIQATNAGAYRVVVENAVGSVTSSNALLAVNIPATIVAGISNQTAVSGTDTMFSVEAIGTGTLFYQWQHNGSYLPGATFNKLVLTNVQEAASGTYTVIVTNAFGNASASGTLTVQQAPFITKQPVDVSVVLGSRALFGVEAGGDAPLSYQWYFKNRVLAGATDSTYQRENVHGSLAGNYHVVISNLFGVATSRVATLTVTYTNNPFLTAAGIYNGLFYENDAVRHGSAGHFRMSLKTNASFSGKLLLDGNSVSFSGKFQANGSTNRTVLRTRLGKSPVTVSLQVDFGADKVIGTVETSNWVANVLADRVFYNNTNPATNLAGKYTVLIPGAEHSSLAPSGFGYGVLTVRTNGRLSFSGLAADKHTTKQSTVITRDGGWPFFTQMYRSTSNAMNGATIVTNKDYRGFMLGWLSISGTNVPSGNVSWIKTGWTNQIYREGFTNESAIQGSPFVAPAKGTRLIAITNGLVSFFDGNLAEPVSHTFTLRTNNTVLTTHRTNLSLSISASAGSFKGSFRDPATGALIPYYGAVLQNQNFGAGFLLEQMMWA